MTPTERRHKEADLLRFSEEKFGFSGAYTNTGIEWSCDKFQTAEGLHNQLSGALMEDFGIQALVRIKIGRGKYSRGIKYAVVNVETKEWEAED